MKLSDYLTENGISQKFFASKIGYTHHYLNEILGERRKPSKQFIKAVNDYLEASQKRAKENPVHLDWENVEREDKKSDDQG